MFGMKQIEELQTEVTRLKIQVDYLWKAINEMREPGNISKARELFLYPKLIVGQVVRDLLTDRTGTVLSFEWGKVQILIVDGVKVSRDRHQVELVKAESPALLDDVEWIKNEAGTWTCVER